MTSSVAQHVFERVRCVSLELEQRSKLLSILGGTRSTEMSVSLVRCGED